MIFFDVAKVLLWEARTLDIDFDKLSVWWLFSGTVERGKEEQNHERGKTARSGMARFSAVSRT